MDKSNFFAQEVYKWFEINGRKFYWRNNKLNPYQVLVLEFLLQKTKSNVINRFFPKFIKKYPSLSNMALADIEDVRELLGPLGLSRVKAKRIVTTCMEIINVYGGKPNGL